MVEAVVDPSVLGIPASAPDALTGGDAPFNAGVVRDVLGGAPGPVRDAVLLNAAAGIAAFDADLADLTAGLRRGLSAAAAAIDSGAAAELLSRWVVASRAARGEPAL